MYVEFLALRAATVVEEGGESEGEGDTRARKGRVESGEEECRGKGDSR